MTNASYIAHCIILGCKHTDNEARKDLYENHLSAFNDEINTR